MTDSLHLCILSGPIGRRRSSLTALPLLLKTSLPWVDGKMRFFARRLLLRMSNEKENKWNLAALKRQKKKKPVADFF